MEASRQAGGAGVGVGGGSALGDEQPDPQRQRIGGASGDGGIEAAQVGHAGAVAFGQHVEAVTGADDNHSVGLEGGLDPFAQ